ncbi:MAG TPA: M15 family metallopeptidase [Oscillospiraceae bacterium]|nr:M15 family metallopeptidase [Oscillospiraceae bacterium]HPF56325.1 M15 family metallopeptidase [Clostridiales bacterium]HPK35666.1 M15 family metallopeptidase [Oscillospiraceae bacterium]HPR75796.1 M15 family metallopeptidase [Oscillospiraceae bacterium]
MKKRFLLLLIGLTLCSGCAINVPTSSVYIASEEYAVGLNTILTPSVASSSSEDFESSLTEELSETVDTESSEPETSVTSLPAFTRNPDFDWALILVNKNNVLPDTYKPEIAAYSSTRNFEARALSYLQAMIQDAAADGIELNVISSYRSPERQVELYNAKVSEYVQSGETQEDAEVEAAKMVAPPGTSEHCTGLAVDIVSVDWYDDNKSLTSKFENTDEFEWLISHCAKYGFILRYPDGKEDITMIDYEPWHYRFVGPDNARYIMENNLTLEEFLDLFQ